MDLYMPEIFWHDRQGILSVDILQRNSEESGILSKMVNGKKVDAYKIATASIQKEIRVWQFYFEKLQKDGNVIFQLSVDFIANILGHHMTTNVVRFSPNGKLLASGDVEGALFVWKISEKEEPPRPVFEDDKEKLVDDFPANKENWVRAFRSPIKHFGDVTCICFSPDSTMIASVATDDSISMHKAETGKMVWSLRSFRHYANGITWDPRGKYLVTVSTDRRLDILDAVKGTRLRCCYRVDIPNVLDAENRIVQQSYKIFHDDQLYSFMRGVDFSPCGSLLFAPAGHLEVEDRNIFGTFVFKRKDFDACRPFAMLPSTKPTIMVKCSPIFYELRPDVNENFMKLPFRLVFAVLCKDCIFFYDTQFSKYFSCISNFQFDNLTNMAWTPDGKVLVVSSLEGYNTFITLNFDVIGKQCKTQNYKELLILPIENLLSSPSAQQEDEQVNENVAAPLEYPDSPRLIMQRKTPKAKKLSTSTAIDGGAGAKNTVVDNGTTDGTTQNEKTPSFVIKRKKKVVEKRDELTASPVSAKRKKQKDDDSEGLASLKSIRDVVMEVDENKAQVSSEEKLS